LCFRPGYLVGQGAVQTSFAVATASAALPG
jgi:hypothetical protein